MASLVLNGSTSGSVTISSPAVSGTTTITLPTVSGGNFVVSDSSGNVGIGTTSPGAILHTIKTSAGAATVGAFLQNSDNTTSTEIRLAFAANTNVLSADRYGWIGYVNGGGTNSGSLTFATTPGGQAATERMRIDSSGNVLVGTTNLTQTTDIGTRIRASGAVYSTLAGTTNATETFGVYSTGAGAYRFYVAMNGTVYATSTTITGISDQRVKENIVDLDDGLDAVMALKPRKFDWKEGKGKDIKGDRGFIAQEFETVFPDMIEEWKDPAPEGEEPYKAVNANLIPVLVKAIQEQTQIINDLKARIETLESK